MHSFLRSCLFSLLAFSFALPLALSAYETSVSALYKSLDPKSIAKQLAFFELYPLTPEGKKALKRAFFLLKENQEKALTLPKLDFSFLIKAVNNIEPTSELNLTEDELVFIEKLSQKLCNRKLKTFNSFQEADFLNAAPQDIDLSRALLVAQIGSSPESQKKIRLYDATLDLMALQIKAKLSENSTHLEKIKAISDFIFFEMGFAFPPHSTYSQEIDSFTYLPSVIDSKKGVCLGISILYLCLAQRLDLPLEIITPPGHIFLRYGLQEEPLNIETTMRGVHIPDERYLGIELKKLPRRDLKETVGLAFINAASIFLKDQKFDKAADLYQKAQKYLPDDPLTKELLGFCYVFLKKEKEGKALLKVSASVPDEYHFSKHNLISDYLEKRIDSNGILEFFIPFEDTFKALEHKKARLEKILKKYPKFRSGLLLLASVYSEMGRQKEAYRQLTQYIVLEPNDPTIAFYLSEIAFRRKDLPSAWLYFAQAKKNFLNQGFEPTAIKSFYFTLKKSALE